MSLKLFILIATSILIVKAETLYEGDHCAREEEHGTCKNIHQCSQAQMDIKQGVLPQVCSFSDRDPIVCCFDRTSKPTAKPTSEICGIDPRLTVTNKTGRPVWDKCTEYQEHIRKFKCEEHIPLILEMDVVQTVSCDYGTIELIVGGEENARVAEFPHMALLGGSDRDRSTWLCSGSLISDRFILTAAHCITDRNPITLVRLGVWDPADLVDPKNIYGVGRTIRHPEFRPPRSYNDIGLIETDRLVVFSKIVLPACLDSGDDVEEKAVATGWGSDYMPAFEGNVKRVMLKKLQKKDCNINRRPHQSYDEGTQLCYGNSRKCQMDSGGPLQVINRNFFCMYSVIGVTSLGKPCSGDREQLPGIYTRVSAFIPWIESIVWP